MSIVKSSWNSPLVSRGKIQISQKVGGSTNARKSTFNQGGNGLRLPVRSDRKMHSRFQARSSGTNKVISRHPDAVPTINFLHMN